MEIVKDGIMQATDFWRGFEYAECIPRGLLLPANRVIWVGHKTTSDGNVLVLEIWGVWSNPSLTLFRVYFDPKWKHLIGLYLWGK